MTQAIKPFLYGLTIGVLLVVGLNTSDRVIKVDMAKVEQKQYINQNVERADAEDVINGRKLEE